MYPNSKMVLFRCSLLISRCLCHFSLYQYTFLRVGLSNPITVYLKHEKVQFVRCQAVLAVTACIFFFAPPGVCFFCICYAAAVLISFALGSLSCCHLLRQVKEGVNVYRFANRIPLLFEGGSDVVTKVASKRIK